ncbi:siderophore ABC transporter substrate-binding protein [Dietzia maris]|uniref:siderophore ABC transporter substrate-binding protein n=1 Tax=Dietzia maris TaxID=37915 RepID=UPI00223B7607|nr:ABC transporter substrate-binding protein [Dietzia maris]MCT1433306.1 ABC transporter substrate-binding protein [Dietzia maris]MCT1520541.1 ABC transporter substrate-binding protein [Dietzia maris]
MKRFPKIVAATAAIALTGGALTACGSSDAQSAGNEGDGPTRVVLTSHAAADTLDELDLEDRVVGLVKTGVFPEALDVYAGDEYTDIGSLKEPNMDVIAELGPDLILFGNRTRAMEPEFAKISDQVIAGDPDTAETIASNRAKVEEIAALFGAEDKAADELAEIDEMVTETRAKAEGAGTALVLMTSGGKVTGYGPGSRFDLIFNELGMTPAGEFESEGSHGAPLSWEQIAELNPDHVFVIDRDAAIGAEGEAATALLDNPLFNRTNAATNDNVHFLDGQNWYLVGGGIGVLESMIDEIDSAVS